MKKQDKRLALYCEEDAYVQDAYQCPACDTIMYDGYKDCDCDCDLEKMEPFYSECLAEDMWSNTIYEADKILDARGNDYVLVDGFVQRWNGSRDVGLIIRETKLEDIIHTYMTPDRLTVSVYEDRVEVENCHHDGTNCYTFTPFKFHDLTIKELKEYFDGYDIENFNDYGFDRSFSNAKKDDLVEFIESYELWKLQ